MGFNLIIEFYGKIMSTWGGYNTKKKDGMNGKSYRTGRSHKREAQIFMKKEYCGRIKRCKNIHFR